MSGKNFTLRGPEDAKLLLESGAIDRDIYDRIYPALQEAEQDKILQLLGKIRSVAELRYSTKDPSTIERCHILFAETLRKLGVAHSQSGLSDLELVEFLLDSGQMDQDMADRALWDLSEAFVDEDGPHERLPDRMV